MSTLRTFSLLSIVCCSAGRESSETTVSGDSQRHVIRERPHSTTPPAPPPNVGVPIGPAQDTTRRFTSSGSATSLNRYVLIFHDSLEERLATDSAVRNEALDLLRSCRAADSSLVRILSILRKGAVADLSTTQRDRCKADPRLERMELSARVSIPR
jgi:hypothetical protein